MPIFLNRWSSATHNCTAVNHRAHGGAEEFGLCALGVLVVNSDLRTHGGSSYSLLSGRLGDTGRLAGSWDVVPSTHLSECKLQSLTPSARLSARLTRGGCDWMAEGDALHPPPSRGSADWSDLLGCQCFARWKHDLELQNLCGDAIVRLRVKRLGSRRYRLYGDNK